MDGAGNLYATGQGINGNSCTGITDYHGQIVKLWPEGDGWHWSRVVDWNKTRFNAWGSTALDAQGNLYGTTNDCGKNNLGTVWQLSP